jgi:FkbM family methyltransferase
LRDMRATSSVRTVLIRARRRLVPLKLRAAVMRWRMLADRQSRLTFRDADSPADVETSAVRLRALGGRPVWIRGGTSDPFTVNEIVIHGDHWPPRDLPSPKLIFDLGANIGVSMALFATAYPEARVVGVEPDAENASLCRRTVAPWGERCTLLEAAAWSTDGTALLEGDDVAARTVREGSGTGEVPTVSMKTLIERHAASRQVDYVKVDIEGAERELLGRNTDWVERVRCISVEIHHPYSVEECISDLERLGFSVHTKPAPRAPRVVGVRVGPGAE